MRILVCIKRVPAPGAKIRVTADGMAVDAAHLGFTTSPHEECAVEEAVLLREATGGSVAVLTLGPPEAEEQLRYAASVGADELFLVATDGTPFDPQRTATALAAAIEDLEIHQGRFDLILFGNESADSGGFQVGIRVAHKLERPMVSGIKGIEIDDGMLIARRAVDHGFELYRLPLPAVIGVKEGINLPRYPTMKGRLASKKVEFETTAPRAEAGGQRLVRLHQPAENETTTEILGDNEAAALLVVDLLEELGLLP